MDNAVQRPTDEELRLFSEKIARRLAERPLDLDPVSHKRRVAELLRQAGEVSFYQLLGVVPTATAQEVHEAYDQVARLVHPMNARRLGLSGREGVLEVLFERVTQAYLTLFQPERRKAYDRDLAPQSWAAAWTPTQGRRREETRDVAQGYYERAMALAAADEFHFAIELLQQAVRIDSRPEYHALLGRLQAKNPRWLGAAAENLRKALEMGSREPGLPEALDQVLQQLAAGEPSVPEIEVLDPNGEEFDVPLPKTGKRKR